MTSPPEAEGRGFAKSDAGHFLLLVTYKKRLKKVTEGGGGSKIRDFWVTSFVNGPYNCSVSVLTGDGAGSKVRGIYPRGVQGN